MTVIYDDLLQYLQQLNIYLDTLDGIEGEVWYKQEVVFKKTDDGITIDSMAVKRA